MFICVYERVNISASFLRRLCLQSSNGLSWIGAARQLTYFAHEALNLILGTTLRGGRIHTSLVLHLRHFHVRGLCWRRQAGVLRLNDQLRHVLLQLIRGLNCLLGLLLLLICDDLALSEHVGLLLVSLLRLVGRHRNLRK